MTKNNDRLSIRIYLSRPRIQIGDETRELNNLPGVCREVTLRLAEEGISHHNIELNYRGGSSWEELTRVYLEDEGSMRELEKRNEGRIILQTRCDRREGVCLNLLVEPPANIQIHYFDPEEKKDS